MNKLVSLIAISSLVVVMAGCGAKKNETDNQANAERVEIVKVSTIQKTKIAQKVELSTTLQGYETVKIAPSLTGKIEHIYVEVGSRVSAGSMLVRMDQNQLTNTKLAFANLGVEFDRVKTLREAGTVSQQTYDQTKLSYDQTKESLDFIESNTFVKAPFAGVIAAKNYEDGELYSGSPILTLTQVHVLKALINIPESYFPLVKAGLTLDIRSDIYPDQTFPATIEVIYPTIDASTHTFQAKVKIPNSKDLLRPGMFARTTLELGEVEAFAVPYQSVLKLVGSNERYVFINDNNTAKRIGVALGQRFDERIVIKSDELKEGDQLITTGQGRLVNGIKLNVVD
ncbi:MAG TPA: efflux RND transporter periplasmic adaptor subunit [Prolixibacteraceae bacterium]|nr:efflux RND transporter periplasmic adaptor subunit [Prolixibacteraceae bacterium]